MSKIPVGILGATGAVGQTYVKLLESHPFFEIALLSASTRWEGSSYREALQGRFRESFAEETLERRLQPMQALPIIFSALGNEDAEKVEEGFAAQGSAVFSHASIHRTASDIPMIIPEINPGHFSLIAVQQKNRQWNRGFIVVKPNCTLQSFLLPLFPLHQAFGLKQALVTTMQSTSGAGGSFELERNIIPHIKGEEEKSESEPLKILGKIHEGKVVPATEIVFSSHCNRVPVCHGHLACVSASFEKPLDEESIRSIWDSFSGLSLPSSPKKPLHYFEDCDRPQPLLDGYLEGGMSIAIGRLRKCSIFDVRFTGLSHNLIRGAAGGSILCAELAYQKGLIHG